MLTLHCRIHALGDFRSKTGLLHLFLLLCLQFLLLAGFFRNELLLGFPVVTNSFETRGTRKLLAHHQLQSGHLLLHVVSNGDAFQTAINQLPGHDAADGIAHPLQE